MLKKLKKDDYNWTGKYIREYNEMVSYYEKQLEEKNRIIESLSLENDKEQNTDNYDEQIENPDEIIKEIEKNDLRELKNNYFTEENPERFTHWELTYNNYFKIVGTYDQNVVEFDKISDILNFKNIIDEETKKVQDKLDNEKNVEEIENV